MNFSSFEESQIHISEYQDQINNEKVLQCILQAGEGFTTQLDALMAKFSITSEIVIFNNFKDYLLTLKAGERVKFAEHIQQFLQKYFASPIHIRVFGSSATGLGFINSDLVFISTLN